MRKNFKKVLVVVLALVFCVSMVVALSACNDKGGNTFKIGLSGPLTGGASVYGIAVKNSAQMAIDEINALGGIQFELKAYDDKHDASNIESIFANMLDDGVQLTLGTVTTAPGLAFNEMAKQENMFFMTPSASANNVVKDYSNGYQMCFADNNQGQYAAEYFKANYTGKKIGCFYNSADNYSSGIQAQFKANMQGASLVEASFTDNKETSFGPQINTLKDCDVIFMPIYYEPASVFMLQAKDTVKSDCVYFGCDGLDGILNMSVSDIPQEISMLTHFDSSSTTGKAGDFNRKYTEKYGKDTLNQFGASAYDCVYAIYQAMTAANITDTKISHSDLCNALCEVLNGDFQFTGAITGSAGNTAAGSNVTWDSNGYVNKSATKAIVKAAK